MTFWEQPSLALPDREFAPGQIALLRSPSQRVLFIENLGDSESIFKRWGFACRKTIARWARISFRPSLQPKVHPTGNA